MAGRRIYLVGSAGYPHYGDDIAAAAWLRHLATTEPDAEVYLDCPNPGGAQLFLGDLHPHVRFVDTVFRLCWASPDDDAHASAEFVATAIRHPGYGYAHRAAGVELMHTADVYHVLGGSYINTIWPNHVGVLAAGEVLASERGVRSAVTGLGLLPSGAPREVLDRVTASYEVLDLRDSGSRALFSHDKASDTGDDALLGLRFDERDSPSTIMCFQSDLVDGDVDELATSAIETAHAWGLRPGRIGYVEAIPGQDRIVFDKLEAELPGIRFYPFAEIWREGLPARSGQRWLTTRQSMHVAAAAAGASGVAFPVKAGYDDVQHQDLVEKGSGWSIGTPGEAAPEPADGGGFGDGLDAMVAAKQQVAKTVYAR